MIPLRVLGRAPLLIGVVLLALVGSPVLAVPAHATVAPEVIIEPGSGFSPQQEREIRALVDEATIPVTVRALEKLPASASGSPRVYADQLGADLVPQGEDGVVLVFSASALPDHGVFESRDPLTLGAAEAAVQRMDLTGQARFVRLVDLLVHGNGVEALDEQIADDFSEEESEDGADDATADEPSTLVKAARWLILGVAGVAVVLLVWLRGRALAGWWRRRGRAKGLEGLATRARHVNLADRAKADLLAFGAEIDAESMDEHDALELWQLALDDYHEASTLLDRRRGSADDEKVIRLCEQGRDRLRKAQRHRG